MSSLNSSPIHNSNVQEVLELIMEDQATDEKPIRSKSTRSSLSTVITADIELDDAEMSLVEEVDLDVASSLEGQEIQINDDGSATFVQSLSPKDDNDIDDPQPKFYSGQAVQLEDGSTAFLHMSPKEGLQAVQLEDGTTAYISLSPPDSIFDDFSLTNGCDTAKSATECVIKSSSKSQAAGSGKAFKCDFPSCLKVYTTQHHLKVHRRSHTGDRPYQCPESGCEKTFTTSYSLKSHIRVHTGETPYHCPEELCSKAFKTSGDLQKHIRTHTGERPFICPFEGCDRSFTTSNIRKVHVRTHTGERPYICKQEGCGRAFASATNFKNHQRIHTGEKPYMCSVAGCRRRFTEYSSLYKHHVVHTVAKPYTCNLCGKHYRQTSTLAMHKRSSHGVVDAESSSVDEPNLIEACMSQADEVDGNSEATSAIVGGDLHDEIVLKQTPGGSICSTLQIPTNLVLTQPQISMLMSSISSKANDATVLTIKPATESGIPSKVQKGAVLPTQPQQILLVTDPAQLAILQQLAQQAKLGSFESTTVDLQTLIKATRPVVNPNAETILFQPNIITKSYKGSKG